MQLKQASKGSLMMQNKNSGSKRGGQTNYDFILPVDTTEKSSNNNHAPRPPTNMDKAGGSRAPSKMQEPQPHGMLSN
jgi:hypothetical protein